MRPDLRIYNLGTDGYGRLIQTFKGKLYDGFGTGFDLSPLIDEYVLMNPNGLRGPQGVSGRDGVDGGMGPQGLPGMTGSNGQDGRDGVDGVIGPQGIQGTPGLTGPMGPQGMLGLQGVPGIAGLTGPQGMTGPVGNLDILNDVEYSPSPVTGDLLRWDGSKWSPFTDLSIEYGFNFTSADVYNFIPPYTLRFDSFTTSTTMSVAFRLNSTTYSFGSTVSQFSDFEIEPDTAGLVILYGVRL